MLVHLVVDVFLASLWLPVLRHLLVKTEGSKAFPIQVLNVEREVSELFHPSEAIVWIWRIKNSEMSYERLLGEKTFIV